MWRHIKIRLFERGLVFDRDRTLERVLAPGEHVVFGFGRTVEILDVRSVRFAHAQFDELVRNATLKSLLEIVDVAESQRAIVWKDAQFHELLGPGKHAFWKDAGVLVIETFDTNRLRFDHAMIDVLATKPQVREQVDVFDLADNQRAIVFKDGRAVTILGAGRHALWKNAQVSVEVFSTDSARFTHPRLHAILALGEATRHLDGVTVGEHEVALLYQDGKLIDTLRQGIHVFWKNAAGKISWKAIDLREQVADVAGQEIITADKVTLRVNLVVTYRVADPLRAVNESVDYGQALYREAQLALRAAVGTKSIDALLADKESVGAEVLDALTKRAEDLGISVKSVGLKDIILPGDMKTLLNQVINATKEAEANLIRRREETAAARSQANTAKLLAETPHLLRLKELELLKDVLSDAKATFVFGQGEIVEQVRSLVAKSRDG
jgi:hypothetical protein